MKQILPLFLLFVVLYLCGLGSKLDGTYSLQNSAGEMSYTFKSNGKVTVSVMKGSSEIEMDYKVDGNKVRITNPQQPGVTQVLTLLEDGSLEGPMGAKFTKQKK